MKKLISAFEGLLQHIKSFKEKFKLSVSPEEKKQLCEDAKEIAGLVFEDNPGDLAVALFVINAAEKTIELPDTELEKS